MSAPWKPSDPARWAALGLADPPADGHLPAQAQTADLLALALILPGADDPVTGIVDAVRVELAAIADAQPSRNVAEALALLGRRLDVASLLLRRADNRVPMPPVYDPDAPTATEMPDDGGGS
jgi:hypothetical protein